jgi:translocation and assembly module TamB
VIWRKITYVALRKTLKLLALLLCLFTVLVTTPIGSQLTISLVNNIDGINADYKAGALIRDIELNSLHLNLATIDIKVTDLVAEVDFSCAWRKSLCIETLKVADFSLNYANNDQDDSLENRTTINSESLFVMPFDIEAKAIEFTNSHLTINQTVIDIKHFTTQVNIKESQFTFLQPAASKLIVEQMSTKKEIESSDSTTKNSISAIFSTLPEVYLPISLSIQQLFIDKLRITEFESKTISIHNNVEVWPYIQNHLSATWSANDVDISDLKTSTTDYKIRQLSLKTKLIPPYKINAQLIAQLDKVTLWPEASNSIVALSLQGSIDALTANVTSKGNISLNSQGKVNLTQSELPFQLQLSADKIPLPLSLAQYAKPSSLYLDVTGDLTEQVINLSSQLNSYGYEDAQLKVSATHQQGLITLNELLFEEKKSNSQLNVHGNVDFQPSATSWQLFAESSGFTLPKINLKALMFPEKMSSINTNSNPDKNSYKGQSPKNQTDIIEDILPEVINGRVLGTMASTGTWSASQWALSINDTNVTGTINDASLIIQGDITLDKSGYFSSGDLPQGQLLVAFNNDQLTLQTFRDDNWHVIGQLAIADINHWYPLAKGDLTGDFTIKGVKDSPIIALNTQLNSLQWQQFYSTALKLTANYQPFNNHKFQLTLQNDNLSIKNNNDDLSIQDIILIFSGNLNHQKLQLDWQGNLAGKLKLSSQWDQTLNQWKNTIEDAAITYQQVTFRNNHNFSLNFNLEKQQLLIGKHCWQGKGLDLCLPNDMTIGESGNMILDLNLDLSLLDELILPEEVQLQNKVSGQIKAHWSPKKVISAQADFTLSAGNITISDQYNEQQVSQWHQGILSFNVNDAKLTSKFELHNLHEEAIININSTIYLFDDFPIDAQIAFTDFNIQPFQVFIRNVVNLQGYVTAELSVNGTITSPLISGDLALERGELLLSQTPNKLEAINAEVQINNNQAEVLGNFFIKNNQATLNGQIAWEKELNMNIDLYAKQLPLLFPPQLVMNVSPTINFLLKEKVLTISGIINVLEGSYNIEKLPQGSIDLSDDVIIINDEGKEVLKNKSNLAINTNVTINIEKEFTVLGQGLESNLFGQLQVTQQQSKPLQLFGNIQSTNGNYQAYGQKLTIDKGELTFNGPLTNPYFNLRASRHIKAEDIEVGLQITGLADALDMQLFSTPTMEAPEMLSYLVRGRGLDSGGGSSTAAASMLIGFGVTNSVGLFDQLEKIPLISNIAVDTEGEGDTTQATISGYVGNRVYLKYGIGVYEPINELTVRLYLLNRLWLEIVSGIEQSSDIYYSFDID